ncbi:hypothetical protein D9M70_619070 [compost metagenome]
MEVAVESTGHVNHIIFARASGVSVDGENFKVSNDGVYTGISHRLGDRLGAVRRHNNEAYRAQEDVVIGPFFPSYHLAVHFFSSENTTAGGSFRVAGYRNNVSADK